MHEEGVVSDFEMLEVADEAHLSWDAFCALDWREKVRRVAFRRLKALIEQHHIADASQGL